MMPQPTGPLAARHGSSALPGLARRGLVEIGTVRVERRPLAGRAPTTRGTRPADTALTEAQLTAVTA